ncbi:hypothetical protein [Bacillus sp. EAC]|uniref:hypothetical protein n=1 Tax=Bacillus sp. EAC TaxID=1978338 RepID=UPI000B43CCAD|nr:hypothetical protein [Bacillus sp. EAC]
MDFKKEFILKTKEIYKETVSENLAFSKMCDKFESYFIDLKESLKKEIEVSNGEFDILIDKFNIIEVLLNQRELVIIIDPTSSIISVKNFDHKNNEQIENKIDIIEYEGGAYKSQVFQSPITRNIIDNYLAVAFRDDIDKYSDEEVD